MVTTSGGGKVKYCYILRTAVFRHDVEIFLVLKKRPERSTLRPIAGLVPERKILCPMFTAATQSCRSANRRVYLCTEAVSHVANSTKVTINYIIGT